VIEKVVSGGQAGVDRAALDVARELGIATGGWVPRGRRAEDGEIPADYRGLVETGSDAYDVRTEYNVRDSDATLILAFGELEGGTRLTRELAERQGKPLLVVDLERAMPGESAVEVRDWLESTGPRVLNVAGPRASKQPRIAQAAAAVLRQVLER
jgi:hypothetical protein